MPPVSWRFWLRNDGQVEPSVLFGAQETLLSPNEDLRPSPVFLVEDEAWTAALDVLECKADTVAVEVDAVVAEERELLVRRGEPQQPERHGDVDEFLIVLVVGEHAQGRQRRGGLCRLHELAMQPRLIAFAHLNQRLLSREARPRLREFGGGIVRPREFRIDMPVEEEDGAADRC